MNTVIVASQMNAVVELDGRDVYVTSVSHTPTVSRDSVRKPLSVPATRGGEDSTVIKISTTVLTTDRVLMAVPVLTQDKDRTPVRVL